jgi:hypothetical protein
MALLAAIRTNPLIVKMRFVKAMESSPPEFAAERFPGMMAIGEHTVSAQVSRLDHSPKSFAQVG